MSMSRQREELTFGTPRASVELERRKKAADHWNQEGTFASRRLDGDQAC